MRYVTVDTQESDEEKIADCNADRIEYHIINVGSPESSFCNESRY